MCRLFGLHAGGEDVNATFWLLDAPVSMASEPMDEDLGWEEPASGELLHVGPDLDLEREIILHEPPRRPLSLTGRAADSQAQEQ